MSAPMAFRWSGEAFEPLPRFVRACNETFAVGEVHTLEALEDRSSASHRHFFAAVRESWMSLKDDAADRFRSPEALRKFALIRAGYADSQSMVASSKAEAQRLAAFMKPMDEFAVITVEGATVTRWTAKTQSMRAMDKKTFQASKEAVLEVLAGMLGTARGEIERHAEAA